MQLVHLNFASKISEKEVNTCLCCEKLRLKLNKAKLKISSYEEIIKLLQKEGSDEGFCSHCNLINKTIILTMSSLYFQYQKTAGSILRQI